MFHFVGFVVLFSVAHYQWKIKIVCFDIFRPAFGKHAHGNLTAAI